jgi:pyridoxine 5-phosphate synthase
MAPVESILEIALKVKPNMVTLVPELTTEVTTERGFDLAEESKQLEPFIKQLRGSGIAVSLFIDPTDFNIDIAHELMADYVELNTSYYSDATSYDEELEALRELEKVAHLAKNKDFGVAVGHGLNYRNVANVAMIKPVEEFSIGHSIVARAIFVGLERAVREMKDAIEKFRV